MFCEVQNLPFVAVDMVLVVLCRQSRLAYVLTEELFCSLDSSDRIPYPDWRSMIGKVNKRVGTALGATVHHGANAGYDHFVQSFEVTPILMLFGDDIRH